MRRSSPGGLPTGRPDLTDELTLVACPGCGATAEIEWQSLQTGTSGPVTLAKLRCLNRHWFLVPAEDLVPASH
jgi:hypothetical protein